MPQTTLLGHLARFVAGLRIDALPAEVLQQARLCVIDTVGCIVSGAQRPEAQALLRAELAANGLEQASALTCGRKLGVEAAARFNGYAGDLLELNDLIGGHASIANVTAALALGEQLGSPGSRILLASVAGIETTARVYMAYYPTMKDLTDVGIAPPGVPSTIGVAAVASVLLGLDEGATLAALSNAAALAGWCPAECFFGEGGTVKAMMHGAWPASVGLLAARYAQHGIQGPGRVLESNVGYYRTVGRSHRPETVVDPGVWFLAHPRRKLHACCGYIHAGVDVMGQLARQHPVQLEVAREIRIEMPAYTVPVIAKDAPPKTPNEARFHQQYCLALAGLGIDTIRPAHSDDFDQFVDRPQVRGLISRMRVVANDTLGHYQECRITLVGADGELLSAAETKAPRGAPENPLTQGQIIGKFQGLVAPHCTVEAAAEFVERVLALEQESSFAPLAQIFEGGA